MTTIPFSRSDIRDEDIQDVVSVLKSGWLTHGKFTKDFESEFSSFTGAKHAITVSNCTAGLHLACLALNIGVGDEVIVPAMTHTATAHAVEYTGASAVFADVSLEDANINVDDIKKKITPSTKAIIIVHMAGIPCDMKKIKQLCDQHSLYLIEDCAHALGTTVDGTHVGNFGDYGVFSFYPTKQIAIGEGGMVICNNDDLAKKISVSKAFGIDTPPEKRAIPGVYDVKSLGFNYRLTDYQSAIGLAQLRRYRTALQKRIQNAKYYDQALRQYDLKNVILPHISDNASYFLYQLLLPSADAREKLMSSLKENGVGCSIHYRTPVPLMHYYREKYGYSEGDFSIAEEYGERTLSLPVHPFITQNDVLKISDIVKTSIISSAKKHISHPEVVA